MIKRKDVKVCLVVLSCLVYNTEHNSKPKEYKSCAIEVSKIKKVHTLEDNTVFIADLGEVKESVQEVASKVNSCKK